MLIAWTTVLYMLVYRAASSVDVDSDLTAVCRQLCSDKDNGNSDARSVDSCVVGCQRVIRVASQNRVQTQQTLTRDRGENLIRSSRGWFFPDLSKWQARMTPTTSGIGSRSRSAGSYLRIGRDSAETASDGGVDVKRRRGRMRSAGRYLRIGRAGESADDELTVSGAVRDGSPEEDAVDTLHLRKVNRDAAAADEDDALQ